MFGKTSIEAASTQQNHIPFQGAFTVRDFQSNLSLEWRQKLYSPHLSSFCKVCVPVVHMLTYIHLIPYLKAAVKVVAGEQFKDNRAQGVVLAHPIQRKYIKTPEVKSLHKKDRGKKWEICRCPSQLSKRPTAMIRWRKKRLWVLFDQKGHQIQEFPKYGHKCGQGLI